MLLRGAAQVETRDDLKRKLTHSHATGTPLRVKYGIDPTGFDVHLGHTVPLRKLRQFQEFGHTAVLIIGTATAEVGDPSGRDAARSGLTPAQIAANADSYLTQIARVIDVTRAEVRPNAEWFHGFDFAADAEAARQHDRAADARTRRLHQARRGRGADLPARVPVPA